MDQGERYARIQRFDTVRKAFGLNYRYGLQDETDHDIKQALHQLRSLD